MSAYCPRCDVSFEKDLPRCPACGYDFRAHILPPSFLAPPLDFSPLKELGTFIARNIPLIWINGITVEVLWAVSILIIYRITYVVSSGFIREMPRAVSPWILVVSAFFATVLFFPMWATYLFSLLRRYRYHVAVPLFAVFAPQGRSRYGECMAWAPLCIATGLALTAVLVLPLDKLNVSQRRRGYILLRTFRTPWSLFLLIGIPLTVIWGLIGLMAFKSLVLPAILLGAFLVPLQAAAAVLLYESLLGRVNLDPPD
jgi:hypothetical protein